MKARVMVNNASVEIRVKFTTSDFYLDPRGNYVLSFWNEDKEDFTSYTFSPDEMRNFIDTFKAMVSKADAYCRMMDAADEVAKMDGMQDGC